MNYELKDKLNITDELLSDLESKSWQEIEHIQYQIDNLSDSAANEKLRQLFKNLLTSYYIFVGGIENLSGEPTITEFENKGSEINSNDIVIDEPKIEYVDKFIPEEPIKTNDYEVISEPFEYFVDFDEPAGDPISDEDLYGN